MLVFAACNEKRDRIFDSWLFHVVCIIFDCPASIFSPLIPRTHRQLYNVNSVPGQQRFNVASAFAACNGKFDVVFGFYIC